LEDKLSLTTSAKRAAIFLLPMALAACASSDEGRDSFIDTSGPNQPFPGNHRAEVLAFMKTYLNNPVGVRDSEIAEPMLRSIGNRQRYVTCLHFTQRESNGSYGQLQERAIIYINGRLDRVVENAGEVCAGAVYAPFPELGKMTR
jgi:hypothetical protein